MDSNLVKVSFAGADWVMTIRYTGIKLRDGWGNGRCHTYTVFVAHPNSNASFQSDYATGTGITKEETFANPAQILSCFFSDAEMFLYHENFADFFKEFYSEANEYGLARKAWKGSKRAAKFLKACGFDPDQISLVTAENS